MVKPHGGKLVNRVLNGRARETKLEEAEELSKLTISRELGNDIDNIARGVFSPLEGFLNRDDFTAVLQKMRLSNDLPWTIPIVLDVSKSEIKDVRVGDEVSLLVEGHIPIATVEVEEIYPISKEDTAEQVFKTKDMSHPGVYTVYGMKDSLIGGKISLIAEVDSPFQKYLLSPMETRVLFKEKGWKTVAGFQTRNAPHLGHEYVQKTALTSVDGIFINPVIGRKKRGDFKDEVILETYESLIENYYLRDVAVMSILKYEMRYAGPREAIFHAIVRKNFGCTYFIVGRDHAGVGDYYGSYEAQEIFDEFPDLGVTPIFFRSFFYCKRCGGVENERTCPHGGEHHVVFSGTRIREALMRGVRPPKELMRPEVAEVILGWDDPFVR